MEQNFEKLETELKAQLERTQESLLKSQQDKMNEMSVMMKNFIESASRGKMAVGEGDPKSGEQASVPIPEHSSLEESEPAQVESSTRGASASQAPPKITIAKPVNIVESVPDLDELERMKELKLDFARQLEDAKKEMEEKIKVKEEEEFGGLNIKDLSLVPDVVIPYKFKTPDFEKYNGTSCPNNHLIMFCRKMAGFTDNEKLLIHCFQDSLEGSALRWYNQLTRVQVKSWKDLAKAFTENYKHVSDMVPNRLLLQGLEQRRGETFREYAQRWRDLAAQVQPPLVEQEVTPMFIDTLKGALFDRLISSSISSFADVVSTGERIEAAIKSGKIDGGDSSRRQYKKKESEVNNAYIIEAKKDLTVSQPQTARTSNQGFQKKTEREPRKDRNFQNFTPLPITYKELYSQLHEADVVRPYPCSPYSPPFPEWYDPNVRCEYHSNNPGHPIEKCIAFKKLVQGLINSGVLQLGEPNTNSNPLPNHGGQGVNMIETASAEKVKKTVTEIKSPLRWVFQQLCMARMINKGMVIVRDNNEVYCEYHQESDHHIQTCKEFRKKVQELMDSEDIEFFEKRKTELEICATDTPKPKFTAQNPFVLKTNIPTVAPRVVITPPKPFNFQSLKNVPWSYATKVSIPSTSSTSGEEKTEEPANDQNGVGLVTQSGRCYDSEVQKAPEKEEGKSNETPIQATKLFGAEESSKIKEPVTESQAQEFLKFLKHSEFSVVEQLKRQPARISVLDLLLHSDKHREALLKVLNQTYVPDNISEEKLDRIVSHITADNFITFSEDEIPGEGTGSIKALSITTHCKGKILPGVLIDNGSALNVMPLTTLKKLPIDITHMRPCHREVRAFDGTQREVAGKIEISLLVGPTEFLVEFVVMDIHPSYNCLLGRPWIHAAGAIPSSLHQKLKFITEGRLVTVDAEQDIIASVTADTPYISNDEEALECAFRALEFVSISYVAIGDPIRQPRLSKCTKMIVAETIGRGARKGRGFGKNLQGRLRPIPEIHKTDRFGLGFVPNVLQRRQEAKKRREQRRARLSGEEMLWDTLSYTGYKHIFKSGGVRRPEVEVQSALKEEEVHKQGELVSEALESMEINMLSCKGIENVGPREIRSCLPNEELHNWWFIDLATPANVKTE